MVHAKALLPGSCKDAKPFCFQLYKYYTSCSKDCKHRFDRSSSPALSRVGWKKSAPGSAQLALLQPSWRADASCFTGVSIRKQFCTACKDLESVSAPVASWPTDSWAPFLFYCFCLFSRSGCGAGCRLGWVPSALLTCPFSAEKQKVAVSVDADTEEEREEGRRRAAGSCHVGLGRGSALKSVTCPGTAGDGGVITSGWRRGDSCKALATGAWF